MKRRVAQVVGLFIIVAVVALGSLCAGLWFMGCRPPIVGRWPSGDDAGPRSVLVGDRTVTVDDVTISVMYARPLVLSDASGLLGPGKRCLALHVRVQNRANATIPSPESGTFALRTSSGERSYSLPVYTPDESEVSPIAIGKDGVLDVYDAVAVPATGALVMVMEPNAISDRRIEIPLVVKGDLKGKPEIIRTGRVYASPAASEAAVGRPIPLTGCDLTVISVERLLRVPFFGGDSVSFYEARIKVASRASDTIVIGEEQVRLQDARGAQWGIIRADNVGPDEADEGYVYIQPGETEEKSISFELPADAKGLRLVILPGDDWSTREIHVPLRQ